MSTLITCRDTLRLLDNPLLETPETHYFLLCLEPHIWEKNQWNTPRLSLRRRGFICQSIHFLRDKLRSFGGDLIVRVGTREHWIPKVSQQLGVSRVAWAPGCSSEERQSDKKVGAALRKLGIAFCRMEANGLLGVEDLPFERAKLPGSFTGFRKRVEDKVSIPLSSTATPQPAPLPDSMEPGIIPDCPLPPRDPRALFQIQGGEEEAQEQLAYYLSTEPLLGQYKKTRNGLLGRDYSSKFSPYLALGLLSPRTIWHAISRYEEEVVSNESTYWLKFELLWREYFRWWTRNQGRHLYQFQRSGPPPANPEGHFEAWCEGRTGVPFVDANMRELVATGFMSNRGRQNVASYLVRELGVDWRWGAAFFEQHLVDYDVASNWGNWASVAGAGPFQSRDRGFNILLQAKKYDAKGAFVRHWLPRLAQVPTPVVHWPWTQEGGLFPRPLVQSPHWSKIMIPKPSDSQGVLPL